MLTDVPAEYIVTPADRRAVAEGYRWSEPAIAHVLKFAATLRDPNDPTRPYRLLAWQRRIVNQLFGWRRPDGRRRFNTLQLWIPKKNGKTSFIAFINLYMFLADGERRPACYTVSTTGENAGQVYNEARYMTGIAGLKFTRTPPTQWAAILNDRGDLLHKLECPLNGGVLHCVASNADGVEGVRGNCVTMDEAHACLQRRPKLHSVLQYAGSGRRSPLVAIVSTAGDDRQGRPFELYSDALAIATGQRDSDLATLAVIYEAQDKDEYTDAELAAANPAVGEVLALDQLRADHDKARQRGGAAWEDFKRYRLNVWCKRSTAWLDVADWITTTDPDFSPAGPPPWRAWGGVDLSDRMDLTAAVICLQAPPAADGTPGPLALVPHFWLPRDGIETRCLHEMDYLAAAAEGHITLCDGPTVDYAYVRAWLLDAAAKYNMRKIGFDPYRAAELARDLTAAGLECLSIKQGWAISEPALKLETELRTRSLLHGPNSVMSWCIGNCEVRRDGNGKIRPVKPVGEKFRRIDGVVAAIMAVYLAMFDDQGVFFCG